MVYYHENLFKIIFLKKKVESSASSQNDPSQEVTYFRLSKNIYFHYLIKFGMVISMMNGILLLLFLYLYVSKKGDLSDCNNYSGILFIKNRFKRLYQKN